MKLLMLNSEFPPLGGGMGTVNYELLKQFSNHENLEIDLITSSQDKGKEILCFAPNIKIIKYPIELQNIHHFDNKELLKYVYGGLKEAIKLQRKKHYDLCMAWSAVPAGGMAYLLKKMYGVPYIVRVSGVDIPGFEKRYETVYKILNPFIKTIWRNSEKVITKCQQETDMILNLEKKVTIEKIFNGVDSIKFGLKGYTTKKKRLKVICVGRLIQRKGQHTLIEATALLKQKGVDIDIDLIGDGDELINYKELANRLNVSERINFLGYVDRSKIANYYNNADVFILPSYNEGMSNALLEAMACGLPVVVTDTGGTVELVSEANGFIVPFGNPEKLAEKINYFNHYPNNLQKMGEASRKIAGELSWNNIANLYHNVFQMLT